MHSFFRICKGVLGMSGALPRTLKKSPIFLLFLICFSLGSLPYGGFVCYFRILFKLQLYLICVAFKRVKHCSSFCMNSYKTRNCSWLLVRPLHAKQLWKSHRICSWVKMAVNLFSLCGKSKSQLLQSRLQPSTASHMSKLPFTSVSGE